ncbi:MAG: hypothetical protein NT113_25205 [Hyphomicrobiales bacterium]|nr:hypothetical protein [Hyphomicrobiales bacterium]
MSKRALSVRYQQAAQRLSEAERKIIEVSAKRLGDLMRLPPIEQLRAIDDPDLIPSDRKKLRQALASNLRRSNTSALTWRAVRSWRGFSHALATHSVTGIIGSLFFLPVCAALFLVWKNTASVVTIPTSIIVEWQNPSGDNSSSVLPAGQKIGIIHNLDGTYLVRHWLPSQGYATSPVAVE